MIYDRLWICARVTMIYFWPIPTADMSVCAASVYHVYIYILCFSDDVMGLRAPFEVGTRITCSKASD